MSKQGSIRLILAGFATKKLKDKFPKWKDLKDEDKRKKLEELDEKELSEIANHDQIHASKDQIMLADYPKPIHKYQIVYESPHSSVEPYYFFALQNLKELCNFPLINKITDIFTAAEHSSFYGASAQKLGLAQDKVSQYLAAIGQFIRKDLFQLIRDLRWLDERIDIHEDARKYKKEGGLENESAEITLKGIWSDMVDGVVQGQRVAANIFQMAQQLQFTSLPDFFFSIQPQTESQADKMVEELDTTKSLKNVLKRKLYDFIKWKKSNYKELKVRKKFELRYLKQHYNIINMYLQWVKPYMKHIAKLRGDISKIEAPELISSFEGSMVEIEILGQRLEEGNKKVYTCILETFEYRTRPSLSYTQEAGFHRGPIHMGELKLTFRAYAWTAEQIENYKQMRQKEDLELFEQINSGVKGAMDAIRDDLDTYLKQAEGVKEEKEKPKQAGISEPFSALIGGAKEFAEIFIPSPKKPSDKLATAKEKAERKKAESNAKSKLWLNYKVFKKAHKMLTW